MPEGAEDNYTLLMALGTWVLADACQEVEANAERKTKKARVVGTPAKQLELTSLPYPVQPTISRHSEAAQ